MMTITIKRKPKLSQVETELKLATLFVGMDEIAAWMMIMRTVRRNTCQSWGTYVGLLTDAAANIIAAQP